MALSLVQGLDEIRQLAGQDKKALLCRRKFAGFAGVPSDIDKPAVLIPDEPDKNGIAAPVGPEFGNLDLFAN
jgi:hypothetical protein